jgi:hypothetical protein
MTSNEANSRHRQKPTLSRYQRDQLVRLRRCLYLENLCIRYYARVENKNKLYNKISVISFCPGCYRPGFLHQRLFRHAA